LVGWSTFQKSFFPEAIMRQIIWFACNEEQASSGDALVVVEPNFIGVRIRERPGEIVGQSGRYVE
jgi:hypothetical protein